MSPPAGRRPDVRRERFEQLFDDHFQLVTAYALRRANQAEAEDAVAETFTVAWRRLDELSGDPKPWLLGVARRVLANQRRAAGRNSALTELLARERTADEDPVEPPTILQALVCLSEKNREALLLQAWEGLSIAEIAAALGCSPSAAKLRLHRGRRQLRAELERLERADPSLTSEPGLKETT